MLLREDERGWLAIGQPSHAWISGQLARAWGNERFGVVEPRDEVCLAAEQHDAGWGRRDLEPGRNPDTGLPYSFMEMPLDVHLKLWTAGPRRLLSQSRYAALLASLHGWRLYERRDLTGAPSADADAIRGFLSGQRAFQAELIAALAADPVTAASAAERTIARNSLLLWTWDYVSLAVCLDWAPAIAKGCPTVSDPVDLAIDPGPEPGRVLLDPWPLAAPSLTVRCEGRRLERRFDDEDSMRTAFAHARWETLELELSPA